MTTLPNTCHKELPEQLRQRRSGPGIFRGGLKSRHVRHISSALSYIFSRTPIKETNTQEIGNATKYQALAIASSIRTTPTGAVGFCRPTSAKLFMPSDSLEVET